MADMPASGWSNLPGSDTGTGGGGSQDSGPETKVVDGYVFQKVIDPLTGEATWQRVGAAKDPNSAGSQPRNDALTAAQAALSGFLQAQSLADARKLAAMQQFQTLGKFALPAGATTAPGYEPGGLAQTLAARQGLGQYTPPPITTAKVNPGATEQPGQVPPEVLAMLQGIRNAGGAG